MLVFDKNSLLVFEKLLRSLVGDKDDLGVVPQDLGAGITVVEVGAVEEERTDREGGGKEEELY